MKYYEDSNFHKIKYDLKGHFCVMERFCDPPLLLFRPSVLMNNFCPCFDKSCNDYSYLNNEL